MPSINKEFRRKPRTAIQEIKNMTESTGSRSSQCEDLRDRAVASDWVMRDTLKTTREPEKWIQWLLNDAKKNKRVIGIRKK